jgi:hypothetical protein
MPQPGLIYSTYQVQYPGDNIGPIWQMTMLSSFTCENYILLSNSTNPLINIVSQNVDMPEDV